jgi:hypothetical protein
MGWARNAAGAASQSNIAINALMARKWEVFVIKPGAAYGLLTAG